MESTINIEGIDKIHLLQCLWENTSPIGLGKLNPNINFNHADARDIIDHPIDYFNGRPIKSNLSGNTALTRLYNRDSKTTFEDVVKNIRVKMDLGNGSKKNLQEHSEALDSVFPKVSKQYDWVSHLKDFLGSK